MDAQPEDHRPAPGLAALPAATPETLARAWLRHDPDPETRAELEALLAAEDRDELRRRFGGYLTFGTAGLRAVMGAGPLRMNVAVVAQATRALADELLARVPDARALPVVVGHDARQGGARFAQVACEVLVGAGLPVRAFDGPVPTPMVAFAVRQLGASAGVMITASHNPPEYNGYKVYGPEGIQVVPPWDRELERRMASPAPADAIPRRSGGVEPVPPLESRYLAEIGALRTGRPAASDLEIVVTPLHGVGGPLLARALEAFEFSRVHRVEEQWEPDGSFPTVRFPNPEEPGALDAALTLARRVHADLLLALDPDADRLAVAAPTAAGRWHALSGNRIGLLLADWLLRGGVAAPGRLVLSSVVSSPLLGAVARAHGARWERTLTGFKWIWTAARALTERGARFVFGYEEALGYSIGGAVRDKDGIAAGALFARLAAEARAAGKSVLEALDELHLSHGLEASAQRSVIGPQGVAALEDRVRRYLSGAPRTIGERRVEETVDWSRGAEGRPPWLGATALHELRLSGGGRVLLRPSGTEPKLKVYVDLVEEPPARDALHERREALEREARELAAGVAASLERA